MAELVELSCPDNVELLPGAVQNWHDLDSPAARSAVLHRLVADALDGVRTCLVAGPHDPELVALVSGRVDALTLAVTTIVDAAALGTAHPDARVLCGHLVDALTVAGTFDLVIALDDVTRLQSLERPSEPWIDLAMALGRAVRPGGRLILGVENELGVHRFASGRNPFTRGADSDWTPLATWDATRPRTRQQALDVLDAVAGPGVLMEAFPDFRTIDVLSTDAVPQHPLYPILTALVSTPTFLTRSLALAGTLTDHAAGWVYISGRPSTSPVIQWGGPHLPLVTWTSEDDDVRRAVDGTSAVVATPNSPGSLHQHLVEACTDADLAQIRVLLSGWAAWLTSEASDGVLPAASADASMTNILPGPALSPLRAAASPAPLELAAWRAIGQFYADITAAGVRSPWPTTMHPRTVLETIGAMAGLTPPADISAYLPNVVPGELATRQELLSSIDELQRRADGAWNRFTWGEHRYAVDRVIRIGKKGAQFGVKLGRKAAQRVKPGARSS